MSVLEDIFYLMTCALITVDKNLLILVAKDVYRIVAQDIWLNIL